MKEIQFFKNGKLEKIIFIGKGTVGVLDLNKI